MADTDSRTGHFTGFRPERSGIVGRCRNSSMAVEASKSGPPSFSRYTDTAIHSATPRHEWCRLHTYTLFLFHRQIQEYKRPCNHVTRRGATFFFSLLRLAHFLRSHRFSLSLQALILRKSFMLTTCRESVTLEPAIGSIWRNRVSYRHDVSIRNLGR